MADTITPDSRLTTGAYLTREGGLFEVVALWWDKNFGLQGGHLGAVLLEDSRSLTCQVSAPEKVLRGYGLVRAACDDA